MAGDYARITPRFWNGTTGKQLRGHGSDAIVVAAYLITCQTRSPLGLYYLPLPVIAHETGLTEEGASEALRRVIETGFCDYDEHEEVVWVPEMAGVQIAESLNERDNRVKWVRELAEQCRKLPFFDELRSRWGKALGFADIEPRQRAQVAPSKPLQRPFEANPSQSIPTQSNQHVQEPSVREMPPHLSRAQVRAIPKTSDDLKPFFLAWCRGSGQGLSWPGTHTYSIEQIVSHGDTPEQVEAVAKSYAESLSPGTPVSLTAFAPRYDHWRAESKRAKPGKKKSIGEVLEEERLAKEAAAGVSP